MYANVSENGQVMSKLTEQYGEFASLHTGIGSLNELPCKFEVGQKPESTIILCCSSKDILDPNTDLIKLKGYLADDTPVMAVGKVRPRCSLPFRSEDAKSLCYFRSHVGFRLTLGTPDWSKVTEVRFSVANFMFGGAPNRAGTDQTKLEISVGKFNAYFEKVSNYEGIVESLVHKGEVGITCEFVVEASGHSREEVLKFANDICILLALASGKTVDWVNMRLYDSKTALLCCHYQHRRISAAFQFDMIDFADLEIAGKYLSKCYPEYKQINPQYHIDTAAFILGDLRPHPLLETRTLLVYSIVDSFSQKLNANKSFEARLKHLLNTFRVSFKNKEVNFFVKSRNSIVHEFESETQNEREEYLKNIHLFHRLILRMLGYDSYYIDVTDTSFQSGSRKHKLEASKWKP